MAKITLTEVSSSPPTPSAGQSSLYVKTDHVLYVKDASGAEVAIGSASAITALTGDVSATGPGSVSSTVNTVGGSSASDIHSAELAANAATSSNTTGTIVKRDGSGNFSAGTITASFNGNVSGNLTGNVTGNLTGNVNGDVTGNLTGNVTGNVSGSAGTFTGSLSGDITGTQSATVVSFVGTSSASNVHSAELLANAATSSNTGNAIVKRDSSGNFTANIVTASLTGNVTGDVLGNLTGNVTGNVSGTALNVTGTVATNHGGTGLTSIGTANQILGVNNGVSALEYKTISGTSNQVLVTHGVGTITLATPQNIDSTATPSFAGTTLTDRIQLTEQSAPSTPSSTKANIYLEASNGFSRLRYADSTGIINTLLRDSIFLSKNTTGSTISKGKVVYVSGADSGTNLPLIALAKADSSTTMPSIGIVLEDISNNGVGRILTNGIITGLNTISFSAGAYVYVSPSSAGDLTSTKPTTPNIWQRVGIVLKSDASTGIIEIRPYATHGEESGTNTGYTQNVVTLTDAATINTDASLGNIFTVTLGGNRTLANPTNPTNGQKIIYRIRQDGTGSRTITFDTAFRFGADTPSITLTTTANKTDYIGCMYNSTDSKWDIIAFSRNF
jgi:hypothetical protein